MTTIVNVQDPTTLNNLGVNSQGQIAISNFPATQVVSGVVEIALFPPVQVVSGAVDVTDRSTRSLGIVTLAAGGAVKIYDAAGVYQMSVDSGGNASVNIGKINGSAPTMASADGVTAANVLEVALGKFNGASIDRVRSFTTFVNVNALAITAGTPRDLYTPPSGKHFRIVAYHLNLSVAGGMLLQDTSGVTALVVPSGGAPSPDLGQGYLSAAINNHLFLDATVSGTVNGWIGVNNE